jgi:thiosulfate/3-mercaptopyruvate sulfurtransferase
VNEISFARLDGATARALIAGGAFVVDARSPDLRAARPFPNAIAVVWQDFVGDDAATRGRLLSDDAILTQRLQALGICNGVPVLIIADAKSGGGEDGRMAGTLRTLGHPAAFLVDGGIDALAKGGLPSSQPARAPGDFVVSRNGALEITKEQLRASIGAPGFVVLDVREPREYAGETPYGESRGGHVLGAKHLFYKDLLNADGYILSAEQIRAKLSAIGVADGSDIAAYCTGGVRAGFVTAVLN